VDAVDFDEAIDRVVGGLERRSRVINPKEKEISAYHEAGHALIAESREHADRVAKISAIPRGVAALGYTQQQPTEDRYLVTRAELLERLDVLLGGRVAEELVFGDVSTGAQDDLQRATDMAHHMVARYGMSETLGLATFEPPRQALFLNVPSMAQREYSEDRPANRRRDREAAGNGPRASPRDPGRQARGAHIAGQAADREGGRGSRRPRRALEVRGGSAVRERDRPRADFGAPMPHAGKPRLIRPCTAFPRRHAMAAGAA
jgi:hypothetical protein